MLVESILFVLHLSYVRTCLQESSLLVQQASLKGELEGIHQQLETSKVIESTLSASTFCSFKNQQLDISCICLRLCVKIEMCEVTAECHRLQEHLRSAQEQQQKTSSSLQQHIISLQQESDTLKVCPHLHALDVIYTNVYEKEQVRVFHLQ